MTDETVTIENVPNVRDIRVLLQAIEGIGAKVTYVYNNSVQINGGSISDINVDYEYIKNKALLVCELSDELDEKINWYQKAGQLTVLVRQSLLLCGLQSMRCFMMMIFLLM